MIAIARRTLDRIRNWLDQLGEPHDCWDDDSHV